MHRSGRAALASVLRYASWLCQIFVCSASSVLRTKTGAEPQTRLRSGSHLPSIDKARNSLHVSRPRILWSLCALAGAPGVELVLGGDALDTFHHLVTAPHLFISFSRSDSRRRSWRRRRRYTRRPSATLRRSSPAAGASATARKYGGSSLGPTAGRVAGRRRTHAHFLRATILGRDSASRRHTRNFNFVWCLCAEGKLERDVSTGEIRGI